MEDNILNNEYTIIDNEDLFSISGDGFHMEINTSIKQRVSGRTPIKISAHEVYTDGISYNKNGISWIEEYTRANLESAIGMPYVGEFLDSDRDMPMGHGREVYDEDGNLSFENSVQVGTAEKAYLEVHNGKLLLMTEGYINNQRYPNFVKYLKEIINMGHKVHGSIEITGKGDSKQIIYKDGRYDEFGQLKVGRKPMIYDYTGLAILGGMEPSDLESVMVEINTKKEKGEDLMDFKELYEKQLADNEQLKIENSKLKDSMSELNTKITTNDENILNASKAVAQKETEVKSLEKKVSELNTKIEEIQKEKDELEKEKRQTEVNNYLKDLKDTMKDFFTEEDFKSLEESAKEADLDALTAKESELCTLKLKEIALKSKEETNETKEKVKEDEAEVNTLDSFYVKTDDVDLTNVSSLSDIK